jgi:Mg2+-importing ATPase
VAKEAADFVLLKPDLDILRQGIFLGRTTFANTLKYVFTTTSASFGNMFSMAVTSLFLPFLPLLPKQILLNNFLSDGPSLTIAADNVDSEWVNHPLRWNIKFIRNFMITFGIISSAFDLITFGTLLFVLKTPVETFRTGWFLESLLTELFLTLVVRTYKPFFQSKPGRYLLLSTLFVTVIAVWLPYSPLSAPMGFVPLPLNLLGLVFMITALYLLITEIAKHLFYKRFHL